MSNRDVVDDPRAPSFLRAVLRRPEAVLTVARHFPQALGWEVEADAASARFAPLFDPQGLAGAVLDGGGRVLAASQLFEEEAAYRYIDPIQVARALRSERPIVAPVSVDTDTGVESALFVYASSSLAQAQWRLPPELAKAAQGDAVVLTTLSARDAPLARACEAFALTPAQTRLVLAVVRTGSIKAAALALGISHVTGRETLSDIYRRTGTHRLPQLVSLLSGLAFGMMPEQADQAPLLVDVWGLTPKQASIALLIASGAARQDAARVLGLSNAVVSKELEQIFAALQVASASELARTVAAMSALHALVSATREHLGFSDPRAEPLRLLPRPDGSRIAWSDYGPPTGKPVLIVHSSMTSRPAPSGLTAALQAKGFRVLSLDRPGFGMSDPAPGSVAGEHDPFETAADDVVALLDALKIPSIDIVARGGAQAVLALAHRAGERVGRVVLVNPDPSIGSDPRRQGLVGAFKEIYLRRPELIGAVARLLAGSLTRARAVRALRQAMRGSPPDERAVDDPQIVEDYWRSVRMAATGRIEGYVNEQVALARSSEPPPRPGLIHWSVLIGAHDTVHDPNHVERYWRRVLPDSRFVRIEDAGRFLAMTHVDQVVAALMA